MAMDCSSAQPHHQEVGLESSRSQAEKKPRPAEQSLKCPRCDSTNTKFCYYNNYSLSQPRYFCKSCRRYWTKGGTLRNVPVGGGCRKTKRSRRNHDHPTPTNTIPSYTYDSNMAIQGFQRPTGLDDIAADYGLIDALRGGFLQLHNLYDGGMDMGMGIGVLGQEMGFEEFHSSTSGGAAAVKQEMQAFPWQINGGGDDGISIMGELVSHARIGNWNSWHGLLNSPLM